MSNLKPGTLCVIIAGCPENIGLIVEVIEHLGRHGGREDAYIVQAASGRTLPQLHHPTAPGKFIRGYSPECITDRHKLRPLVDPKDGLDDADTATDKDRELAKIE
jgi:hypothetical protein